MPLVIIALLILLFFITGAIGVVTGSNSLITVPVMFQFGVEPKVAIATNMFGLTFMSIGASIPFLGEKSIDRKRLVPLIPLTLIGSAIGAFLVGYVESETIPLIVSISMICVVIFTFIKRDVGVDKAGNVSTYSKILTFVLTFFLGIYGGLYSGGYVTILTAIYVAFFGMNFTESIAATKFINVFSSSIATIVFAWQGLIDYKLGIILAVTMFIGAYFGAKVVVKIDDIWLKRIFMTAAIFLAIKTIFDFIN